MYEDVGTRLDGRWYSQRSPRLFASRLTRTETSVLMAALIFPLSPFRSMPHLEQVSNNCGELPYEKIYTKYVPCKWFAVTFHVWRDLAA